MLLALAKKLHAEITKTTDVGANTLPAGSLTVITLYDQPRYGEVDGQPVTILGEGNMIGYSPVTLLRDADNEEAWIPKRLMRSTDPRLAPIAFTGFSRGKATKAAKSAA